MSANHAHRRHPVRLRAESTSSAERAAAAIAARELRVFQIQPQRHCKQRTANRHDPEVDVHHGQQAHPQRDREHTDEVAGADTPGDFTGRFDLCTPRHREDDGGPDEPREYRTGDERDDGHGH